MQPIDKPFRFTRDFCIVWALLAVGVHLMLRHERPNQTWYSYPAMIIIGSLLATFLVYGPVLLARQIIQSGSRGWFVARVFISIVLAAALFAAILYFTGNRGNHYVTSTGMAFIATLYLNSRLKNTLT